eukprot:TRINITY_DN15131_c0_g1_i1.p2 TRINITY_DN15131_c0_g1~~TRINITY_DN15131_c0_g1_i1.p2  ORF type:complete len:111 (-),score=35.15 TRINITY_DN15131_c0_g1_i1:28-330(-)
MEPREEAIKEEVKSLSSSADDFKEKNTKDDKEKSYLKELSKYRKATREHRRAIKELQGVVQSMRVEIDKLKVELRDERDKRRESSADRSSAPGKSKGNKG